MEIPLNEQMNINQTWRHLVIPHLAYTHHSPMPIGLDFNVTIPNIGTNLKCAPLLNVNPVVADAWYK